MKFRLPQAEAVQATLDSSDAIGFCWNGVQHQSNAVVTWIKGPGCSVEVHPSDGWHTMLLRSKVGASSEKQPTPVSGRTAATDTTGTAATDTTGTAATDTAGATVNDDAKVRHFFARFYVMSSPLNISRSYSFYSSRV